MRKAKSLVGRWLDKTSGSESAPNPIPTDILIERNIIILVNVSVGRGALRITMAKPYRVVDVHDKFYSKWFMSKSPVKKGKEDSKFKLKSRMQEVNVIQEYEDVKLHDTLYKKGAVSRIVTGGEIVDVIGKLQKH